MSLDDLIATPLHHRQDVTIDLTCRRSTKPVWLNARSTPDLDLADLPNLAGCRVTFGNVGDPLLHPNWRSAVAHARECGAAGIHIETDLLCPTADLADLLDVDVISVHLPGMTAKTYAHAMGAETMPIALGNLARLLAAGTGRADGGPIVVPTFVKLASNVAEMEAWYDQWTRAAGSAVVRGPDALNLSPADDVTSLAAAPLNRTERPSLGRIVSPTAQAA